MFIDGTRLAFLPAALALNLCAGVVDGVKPESQQALAGETLPGQGEELLYDGRLSFLSRFFDLLFEKSVCVPRSEVQAQIKITHLGLAAGWVIS